MAALIGVVATITILLFSRKPRKVAWCIIPRSFDDYLRYVKTVYMYKLAQHHHLIPNSPVPKLNI